MVGVNERLLKTSRQFIEVIWYNTSTVSVSTTAEGREVFHHHMTEDLNSYS